MDFYNAKRLHKTNLLVLLAGHSQTVRTDTSRERGPVGLARGPARWMQRCGGGCTPRGNDLAGGRALGLLRGYVGRVIWC